MFKDFYFRVGVYLGTVIQYDFCKAPHLEITSPCLLVPIKIAVPLSSHLHSSGLAFEHFVSIAIGGTRGATTGHVPVSLHGGGGQELVAAQLGSGGAGLQTPAESHKRPGAGLSGKT